MARRDFRLRFLLNPAYVVARCRELRSLGDVLARAADLLRYAFDRLLWDPFFALRGFAIRCGYHWQSGYYALRGLCVRSGLFWQSRWHAFRAQCLRFYYFVEAAARRLGPGSSGEVVNRGNRRFCSRPFRTIEIHKDGDAFFCCPTWLPTPIGNVSKQPFEEVWNGPKARAIRESILDDSFRYCDAEQCPHLRSVSGPVQRFRDVADAELREISNSGSTVTRQGPAEINCAFDRSCNLSCPSCRTEVIVETGKRRKILEIQRAIEKDILRDAVLLSISGSGDPFGSPFFRDWLQNLRPKDLGGPRRIHLHSNGQLWTSETWNSLPEDVRGLVTSAEISIDAASPEVYAVNRRGGSLQKLLENFEFITGLRRRGPIQWLIISMVVQENNFLEMPAFVRLGQRLQADRVYFMKLTNWGAYSPEEFARRAVHLPAHPRFSELVEQLQDPILGEPIVLLGNLSHLRDRTGCHAPSR